MLSEEFARFLIFRHNLIRLSVTFILTFAFVWKGNADTAKSRDWVNDPTAPAKPKPSAATDNNEANDKSASTGTRRDPFLVPAKVVRPPKPPKPAPIPKPEPKPIPPPNIETRVNDYKKQVREFYEGRSAEPSKLAPYLIEELSVTGIFRNDEGYGAFVVESVTQKQQTFFARTGWKTFDGYIKEVLPTGVRFVKTVRLDNGTTRQTEEFRALPAVNAK